MNYQNNDHPASYSEHRDCVVRALATLTGGSYVVIAEWLRARKYKRRNCGTHTQQFVRDNPEWMGWRITRAQALPCFGRYLVVTQHHAYAVVDGVRHDTFWDKRQIRHVFRFEKIDAAPTEIDKLNLI